MNVDGVNSPFKLSSKKEKHNKDGSSRDETELATDILLAECPYWTINKTIQLN